jgi:phenylacetic acid degradation operon negative regulatory protein
VTTPTVVKRLVKDFTDRRPMRTKSLIVTVFGDVVSQHGGTIWLGSLVQALSGLGINERLVRTSVFRLAQEGWLEAERVGRRSYYRFSDYGIHEYERTAGRIYDMEELPWTGRWQLVMPLDVPESQRDSLRRSLHWQGFRQIAAGTFARPGTGGPALRALLDDFELNDRVLVLEANTSDLNSPRLVRELVYACWKLEEVAAEYAAFLRRYQPLLHWLEERGAPEPATAFVARTLLIHDYRRLLLRDTRLPEDLMPPGWPGADARQLTAAAYRRLARPSSEYVTAELEGESGPMPAAVAGFDRRFRQAAG